MSQSNNGFKEALPFGFLFSVNAIWSTAILNKKFQWIEKKKKQQLETKALQVAADKYSIVTCWREPSQSVLNTGQKA